MADLRRSDGQPLNRVAEATVAHGAALDETLGSTRTPFVVRGLVSDWPLVEAGLRSAGDARAYLMERRRERAFTVSIGEPKSDGRLFYDDAMAMNFRMARAGLPEIFGIIDATETDIDGPPIYLSSIDVHDFFNGLHEANNVPLGARDPIASIWIGTRTRIAAHNDFPDNLACCAVGRRRFTLFPPDQFANLYLGPVDHTPAGRTISMVDFAQPDFGAFPRFRDALDQALVAELEPGDALFIPSLWWHHVEALSPFNVLVNYWWRDSPRFLGQPQDALNHAMLTIRDLPLAEKENWRALFNHYVFDDGDQVAAHIPTAARGVLAPLTAETAGQLRANILRGLSQ